MNTLTSVSNLISKKADKVTIPQTGRGRALHTVDWFMNGKPVLRNHDKQRIHLRDGLIC